MKNDTQTIDIRYVAAVYPITGKTDEMYRTTASTVRELIADLDSRYGGFQEMFIDETTGQLTLNTMIYYGAPGDVPIGVLNVDIAIVDGARITFW